MNINKVSQSIAKQTPEFIGSEYPLFNKFIEYYYRSQEKTGLGQNILNNFLQYLDIDKLDIGILDGATKIVEPITANSESIVVESVDQFLDSNGSILIGGEVIYYESTTSSPNIALSPGISYDQVKLKWTTLAQIINDFDGSQRTFPLTSQANPVAPPTAQHLIVSVYGEVLIPGTDYTVDGTNIVFTTAPRTRIASDDNSATYITFLSGFIENPINAVDNLSNAFGEGKTEFKMTRNGIAYFPIVDEYVIAVYDNKLLEPKVDFFLDGDNFIFAEAPLNGRFLSIYSVEAPIPSFGSGALGYARVNDAGELTSISINETGSGYRYQYPPKVSINAAPNDSGIGASATALVNGVKNFSLLEGGRGYSDTNPPTVIIELPTVSGSKLAELKATVTNGSITALEIVNSGSGYTFTPRVTFRQPGGAKLAPPTLSNGSISGGLTITDGGQGYSTPPVIYVDEPTGLNPIKASFQAVLTDGVISSITTLNAGQGYTTVPRVAVIDPTGAQVLETQVDGDGRVIGIDVLSGGSGYDDVPSVYIVDNRQNGGTGATATASIFNGRITDINIGNFGSGYSAAHPPTVIIQAPPQAEASVEIGLNEITGFSINKAGKDYSKAKFVGCARAASGITSYTETGNAVFSNNTMAMPAAVDDNVKCLDAIFVKRLLDKYTEQFLPDVPELDYKKIDVRTAIKSVKDFYSAKGTSFSVAYLFKLLYGEQISISYPKDQIVKPSSATWSIDTILRATLVSGNPTDIKDGLLTQEEDIADPNIRSASALVENYISIKTSDVEIFELVLSEETISGSFTVPYKTKLAEPLGTEDNVITVDSTIGWPERNGEFVIGGSEVVQYKEKSLNQFIECTRSVNNIVEDWDSATEVSSNFTVFINKGTPQEVVMNVVGIVDAQQTTLTDTGSYYLSGDKLTVSKLGGTSTKPELGTWLYNVKKLIEVTSVTFGGIDDRFATITCSNPHGLLVGDQVTVYGANPIIYNGSFLVTSRDSETVFQYQLPQPATVVPQGNILVSVDLNKGKSDNSAILNSVGPYTTNVQNSFFNDNYVYVASTGIPNYKIGPFPGSALLPGNQRKLNRFPLVPSTISTKNVISAGPIGTWVNGVSAWSYKSSLTKTFGPVTSIDITDAGSDYDAASPPTITVSGGGGSGAAASVVVDGSITSINVDAGGTGYTSSPLVSIVGGGGSGAAATAIITKGVVSRILMNSGGTGYTSQPSITIVGGGGQGATATAAVRGPIKSISVDSGGASYTSKPTVSLSSGSGAVAQAIVNNGRIISIAIISAGSGYTTAPEVSIQGDGFGAIARATIDTDGENAGRVTSIEILNRGINYVQGTTIINLTSVGQNATFASNVFQWTYNLQETTTFDEAKGAVFSGYNNQYGGEYAHLSNPQRLRYILGDNLIETTSGAINEQETQLAHSPIIGWAFDGNPIYGPYGYTDPTDQSSEISRLDSSYRLISNLVYNDITNPYPSRVAGPLLTDEAAGKFIEDYEYIFGLGDLDQYNGRFCKTPDFPEGRYCYFVTIDTTEDGNPIFPYVLGPSFNSIVDPWNLNKDAVQQNIPTGVVRYRDPYENVDIDVERAPNASTNALTTEAGDILLFDAEDENRDGIISQDEIDDPDQLFEESPLQLFDYFPKVRLDSKVDIEVETITKFEDASVTGFIIENPGKNYQVNDILTFDNTGTEGIGVSARVSRITGETITSYGFETVNDKNYGVVQTQVPHNIVSGDTVYMDYTPIMDNTNKTFIVRQLKGIEELVIDQTGSGYDEDIPPTIIIDGDGESAELQAVVTSVGSIEQVNIINSGSGYTKNPRVILSHPQVFKKADYFVSLISHENYVKVNDVVVNENKETFFCGKTKDASGNEVAFISKFSNLGVKEWEKTLESQVGQEYTEFIRLDVSGDNIWAVGENKPNQPVLAAYNPDVFLAKYVQSIDGLSATLSFQKGYAGISGSTRADHVTAIKRYSDTRYIIGGFTNTNSTAPYDAYIASIDSTGNFSAKRKIATAAKSEKLIDLIVLDDAVYFVLETSDSSSSNDVRLAFGKATIGTSVITIDFIKEINNTLYSFLDVSLVSDEFKECYVTATLRLKSNNTTKDSFWVGKFDTTGDLLWNYRYIAPVGNTIQVAPRTTIDIFGDLNVAYTRVDDTTGYRTVDTVKIGYDGVMKKQTNNSFTANNIEGINVHGVTVDNSGDVYTFGQTSWNRNEFLFPFTAGAITDTTGHYTLTNVTTSGSVTLADNVAKINGYQTGQTSWTNGHLKVTGAQLGTRLNDNWTFEMMVYKDSTTTSVSPTQHTLLSIGDSTVSTGGLWLYYDVSSGKLELVVTDNTTSINSAGSALQSTATTMFANNTWQFVALKKEGDTFTGYVNGIQVFTGTIASTSLGNKDLLIGQISGRDATLGTFRSNEQGQFFAENVRLRNRAITPTVPADVTALPTVGGFGFAYDWTDDAWFTTNTNRYDYIDYVGFGLKTDKNSDAARLGDQGAQTNTGISFTRTDVTAVIGSTLTVTNVNLALGGTGIQTLDFDDATITMQQDTEALTYTSDTWSSRTSTVPSPGSQKLKVSAVIRDRYYMKVTNTVKIDNVQELTINQGFNFTVGAKLRLNNTSGSFINSGYILSVDKTNNKVFLAVNNNEWTNDLNTGLLVTEQFAEQSTYGITGPVPDDTNEIENYSFNLIDNTTPGTFDIDLDKYNVDGTYNAGGGQNLDSFAKFKPFDVNSYAVKIEEVAGGSAYIVGSVVQIASGNISFNAAFSTAQITGLTGVLKITLVSTLDKILQVTAVANTNEVYAITADRHYLTAGENISVDGNPSETVGGVVYDEYDGSFTVDRVVSSKEFVYKLKTVAVTSPATSAGNVNIFVKSPVLKMYYGHQYLFDLSHSSLVGSNLSFSKDNLFKLEYSFNSIERIGTPGVTGQGQPTPTVKLKVDNDVVTNISYYFDPSRTGADSPIAPRSYLDIVDSPYVGTFTITTTTGGTITTGDNIFKFLLANEPEGVATVSRASYSTSSLKAVGPISDIRIVNSGGFYSSLPIVTGIQSSRKIERVDINEPGTEYAVGVYNGVPIGGDGEGGLVSIRVADGTDSEGVSIPGQIQEVVVTSPGKGYTTATIDIEAIDGILGAGLTGSGAELSVVIPPFGTAASVFTKGDKVGKIKKLKNNNFGYDYPHDYTLRPEITFPINAQLTSTSILDSITVTNPGSGYSQAPAVVITGGGGTGAIAEASIRNGRIDQILVKDPGAGYSSEPTVALKSSFNYVVNLDLGLLQFAFPHGIQQGAAVTLNVVDTGDGADFPLAAGALGRLNSTTTYYAIAGSANSLEDDQLKLAITPANAELGDSITFANAGIGRQQLLTTSFGATATANVITSTFLEGELVYQGDSLETATATGYVSTNKGWQVGPRILKIVDYTGDFAANQRVTGVISKSSGIISDLKIAKGVLEIGSITRTTGQFIDDVGKPSEIIQKIQDSYYYQDFSYAVKSSVSIDDWKDILIKNVHPASFKVFGELNLNDYGSIPNKETDFQLTKSVELARESIVPNIQNFSLVEPLYSEFNNTEVLFRQKRLTSSENILTSVVQRVDDISNLFDGERISFPLTVAGNNVVANANQLLIVLNGVAQTPNTSFEIQGDAIVFSEPPQPPASVKYVNVTVNQIDIVDLTFTNQSGIFPLVGNTLVGVSSTARLTVTKVVGDNIQGFITEGTFILGELCTVGATGFSANLNTNNPITNIGLFAFGETVTNLDGDTAKVEQINLERGQETPLADLRYTIGAATTQFEVIDATSVTDAPVPAGTFTIGSNYQFGSEIFTVGNIVDGSESTTLTVTRGQVGTQPVAQQEDAPIYGTQISVTNTLTLSKTAGTYQSTPGLYDIQLNDYIIGASSNVVAQITSTAVYTDPTTNESIGQVNISEGSSFFGLLFNRITSQTYPNIVLDDISKSQVSVVQFDDNATAFNTEFPSNELINNYIIPYDNATGDLQQDEFIRNYRVEYGNTSGDFTVGESGKVRKLTFTDAVGDGFFAAGHVIRTEDTKAEVIGYNQARKTLYLGKIGRTKSNGQDYHAVTFANSAQLDTAQKQFGPSSLLVTGSTNDYISIPSSAEFGWSTGAYTIEMYIRPATAAVSGTATLADFRAAATEVAGRLYLQAGQIRYNVNGSDLVTSGATTVAADNWYHIAVQKSSTTVKIYLNGTEVGTGTDSANYPAKPVRFGADYAGANGFTGHIDEIRLSNTNRYTTVPFTPQAGIFQGDANSKLLLHLDGADAQTYTEDWSGAEGFTKGEDFNNDAILRTTLVNSSTVPAGFIGNSQRYYDAADLIIANKDFVAKEVVFQMRERYPELVILGTRYTPTNATYDAETGLLSMTVAGNSLTSGGQLTPDSVAYDPTTGVLTITKLSHGVTNGQRINIKVGGITFTCAQDSNATNHPYPRSTDPIAGKWLKVANATTDTFTVNVGVSSNTTTHTFVSALANAITIEKDRIKINDNALTFTCAMDGNTSNKTYPRSTDPASKDVALPIISSTSTNLTVNVGPSPLVNFQPSNATYDPATGEFVMTIANHTINVGTHIRLTADSFTFTCTQDGNSANKTYPRATAGDGQPDPAYNTALEVTAVGTSTQNISSASYNPTTGILTVDTSGAHSLSTGDRIQIADESLTFTCAYDSNATNHTYPRQTDPIRGEWVEVTVVDSDTFTIDIGVSSDTSTHAFVSATAGALIKQTGTVTVNVGVSSQADQYAHTFVSAAANAVVTGGNYVHTFVSAVANSVIGDEKVNCEDDIRDTLNAIVQDIRNGSNNHIWDASSYYVDRTQNPVQIAQIEPAVKETLFAYEKVDDMLQYIITNTLWPVEGDHGLTQFTDTTITDSTTNSYTQFTPTGATYDPATGDLVITIGTHSLTTANRIALTTGGISFTCTKDGNDRITAYPRATDPAANAVLAITAVVPNTSITVNVGKSGALDQYVHTYSSALSNAVTVLDYTTADCADVYNTVGNLIDILTDTISNAALTSPVDHLASVTKVEPAIEFAGGTVNAYLETDFTIDYQDTVNDLIYTNAIGPDSQYRFRDAAGLIRANRTPIVDKAAADMITLYPDLAQDMPRNQGGGSTDGTLRCKTDLGLILDAIANDIEEGGNKNTVTAGNFYVGASGELQHVRLQAFQSIYAHDRLGFYAKQAITGDLDETNTTAIIVGDWGITQDGGGCANVKTAIDTLITTINDIIAPTSEDFNTAANRLYFNRDYIVQEITGLTTAEFTYQLNNVNYSALNTSLTADLELIILSIISDLQTGGNSSTIKSIETYINANLTLKDISDILLATLYSIEQIKTMGERAVQNLLYDQFDAVTGNQYAAQYASSPAYRDNITPTDINQVIYRIRDLVDEAVSILSPGRDEARSAAKNLLYNKNYYKEEISTLATAQFGTGAWTYGDFIDGLVEDIVHDLVTTDVTVETTAYTINVESVTGNFVVGENVDSSNGGEATVLEWDEEDSILYVGSFRGSAWVATNTLTGAGGATATISTSGVSSPYDWHTSPANVKILTRARNITSNISGQVSGTNLFPDPENFNAAGWTNQFVTKTLNAATGPDGTLTADKLVATADNNTHFTYKNFAINSFETFDSGSTTFDSGTETFDTGSVGIDTTQTFTFSVFLKSDGTNLGNAARVMLALDDSLATRQQAFFDVNLDAGTSASVFTPQGGITVDAFGVVPYGDGWYRAYITTTFAFGFSEIRTQVFVDGGAPYAGNATSGIFAWGAKLNKGTLDPYTAGSGQIFYADTEYNIKNFAIDLLEGFMGQALDNTLVEPSPNAGFYKFYDSTAASDYSKVTIQRSIRYALNIIRQQLNVDSYYTTLIQVNGISVPAKTFGTRDIPVGIAGGLNNADYIYGLLSNEYAELENISLNEGQIVQVYQRFRIDGDITDGPYTMGETVAKQGAPSVTGVVYGFFEDANYKYLDVRITAGPWAITDNIVGALNSTTAQISAIENRIHIIDLKGNFVNNIPFKGYTSGYTALPTGFLKTEAAVTSNSGGTLTVDTETLSGTFEKTSVIYPESSRQFLDVSKYAGLDVQVGQRIASEGHIRLGISIISNLNVFTVGNRLYKVVNGNQDANTYGIITEVDLDNNFVYISQVSGTIGNGDLVGDYGVAANFPVGYASVSTKVVTAGAAAALVQDIRLVGLNKRLYLSDIRGTFDVKDSIKSIDGYRAAVVAKVDLKGRVKRSFRGFDGTQTTFKLTTDNGTQYLPDPAGHLMIFVNGVLQPPGATNAFTAFSDQIQFTEAPDLGASFTGFYVGKLRQLDDISFEFDSLRQSFNLKRNDVFYSLTLTEGVQSTVIRPENNIIVSLNGVLQEPGVGFEIVGSRIIFSEIPRVGSTFVAFSYVGSEADVDAAEVVPPIEPGDFIEIQGETTDRQVALIESSNSLITFDYLGSVFGQDGQASAQLTSGFIDKVQVTGGGSGYTSRPTVRLDSISGFDGQIRALVGVAGVELSAAGSGYKNPSIDVETSVPDDWTAPDLSLYGEEVIDPEIL